MDTTLSDLGAAYYAENYPDLELQNSAKKLNTYLDWVRASVPPGSRLFELGVGCGHFLRIAKDHFSCTGCDVNSYGVEQARALGIEVALGSSECLPTDASLDAVVSWDVLEHIPDVDTAARRVHQAVRPGGMFSFVVPVYDGPLGWLVHRLDKDPTHLHKWGRKDWVQWVERAGFEVAHQAGILRKLVGTRYLHFAGKNRLLRWCGSAYFISARRIQ